MQGHFQSLIEALERIEEQTASVSRRIQVVRRQPTHDNAQTMLDELRALQKELRQIEKYFRPEGADEIMDVVRAISDALYCRTPKE